MPGFEDDWLAQVQSSPNFSKREVQTLQAQRLCKVSLVVTLVAAAASCIIGVSARSSALLGAGLENLVDFVSTGIVAWRFGGDGAYGNEEVLDRREKRASIGR